MIFAHFNDFPPRSVQMLRSQIFGTHTYFGTNHVPAMRSIKLRSGVSIAKRKATTKLADKTTTAPTAPIAEAVKKQSATGAQ